MSSLTDDLSGIFLKLMYEYGSMVGIDFCVANMAKTFFVVDVDGVGTANIGSLFSARRMPKAINIFFMSLVNMSLGNGCFVVISRSGPEVDGVTSSAPNNLFKLTKSEGFTSAMADFNIEFDVVVPAETVTFVHSKLGARVVALTVATVVEVVDSVDCAVVDGAAVDVITIVFVVGFSNGIVYGVGKKSLVVSNKVEYWGAIGSNLEVASVAITDVGGLQVVPKSITIGT